MAGRAVEGDSFLKGSLVDGQGGVSVSFLVNGERQPLSEMNPGALFFPVDKGTAESSSFHVLSHRDCLG